MYCANCGKQLDADSVFCSYCGAKNQFFLPPEPARFIPVETRGEPGFSATKKGERQQTKQTIARVKALLKAADSMLADFGAQFPAASRYAQMLREESVQTVLAGIEIEKLSQAGQGLRLKTIRSAGIVNVAQLLRVPFQQLTAIPGVGAQTAHNAKAAAESMARAARENARLIIDPERPTALSTQLLKTLYIIQNNQRQASSLQQLLVQKRAALLAAVKLAKISASGLRSLFASASKKENALISLRSLSGFLAGPEAEAAGRTIDGYQQAKTIGDRQVWRDFSEHSAAYYTQLEPILGSSFEVQRTKGDLPKELIEQVEAFTLNTSLLKSSLRGYQVFGAKYALVQQRTLLGDEMGLGKTVEAIAAMAHLRAEGAAYFFVVCPASVLINWCREIALHSSLKAFRLHGDALEANFRLWLSGGGVAVTTYETLKTIRLPGQTRLDMLIVDEAHYAKNPSAQRTQAVGRMRKASSRVLFMTGTPLENRVDEMKSLIGHLRPDIAGQLDAVGYLVNAAQFRSRIAPVYLRRNREDVLNELPELVEMEEWLDFGPQEEARYREAVEQGRFMYMRRVAWSGSSRQESPKLDRLLELCDDARENNRKVIIYSFFRDVIATVSKALGPCAPEPITGSVSPARRQQIIDDFTKSPAGTALVCQVQAGGVGLNIQAASVIILCEPQIKPALETQAISRAYRMGQIHKVVVHRLLTEDSVDERMMEILGNKQQLFNAYARDSVVADSSLQAKDVTEKSLINRILEQEQKRLGFTVTPADTAELDEP